MTAEPASGYDRLDSEIAWYDKKSGEAQRNYKLSKFAVIVSSAILSIVALQGWSLFAAGLGALIAVLEGIQSLNQWHHNWITYRSTCEALRHEKYTYLERADPYDDLDDASARKLLVERVESLISTEHSKWIASQESAAQNPSGKRKRPRRAPN
jgi:hypothetical protein